MASLRLKDRTGQPPVDPGGNNRSATIYQLNEEHGLVDVSRCANPPKVGDRVRIVPNHTCVVANLFDQMFVVSGGRLAGALPVEARGRSG